MSDSTDASDKTPLLAIADEKFDAGSEQELLSNIALRERVAKHLLWLFIGTNIAVVLAIVGLTSVDYSVSSRIVERATTQPALFEKLLASPDVIEKSRSVNASVLMTLIGATTVQVGAGVIAMTQYLFPKKS